MHAQLSRVSKAISAMVLASAMPVTAHAVLVTPLQVQNFNNTGTVTANGGADGTLVTDSVGVSGSHSFGKFDPNLGVLTGASVTLTGAGGTGLASRTQTLSGGGSSGTGTESKQALGVGLATNFTIAAPGFDTTTVPDGDIGTGNICTTTGAGCTYGPTSPPAAGNGITLNGVGNDA